MYFSTQNVTVLPYFITLILDYLHQQLFYLTNDTWLSISDWQSQPWNISDSDIVPIFIIRRMHLQSLLPWNLSWLWDWNESPRSLEVLNIILMYAINRSWAVSKLNLCFFVSFSYCSWAPDLCNYDTVKILCSNWSYKYKSSNMASM